MPLTYNLMGIKDSYSSNNDETSQSVEPPESRNSRKRTEIAKSFAKSKGKRIVNEGATRKKQKLGQTHSSISATSRNLNNISIPENKPLGEMKIPSPIHEERNVKSI